MVIFLSLWVEYGSFRVMGSRKAENLYKMMPYCRKSIIIHRPGQVVADRPAGKTRIVASSIGDEAAGAPWLSVLDEQVVPHGDAKARNLLDHAIGVPVLVRAQVVDVGHNANIGARVSDELHIAR